MGDPYTDKKCESGCGAVTDVGGYHVCCTTECCAAPTPRGHQALQVVRKLKQSGCNKPLLAGSDDDGLFEVEYQNVWSVYKKRSAWSVDNIDFLYEQGARSFAILGPPSRNKTAASLKRRIEEKGARVTYSCIFQSETFGVADCWGLAPPASEIDAFAGLGASWIESQMGDGDLELFTRFFETRKYDPKAAMFFKHSAGLHDSFRQTDCCPGTWTSTPWLYDMWMGSEEWTADLPFPGPTDARNPYYANSSHAPEASDHSRYMGSAQTFQQIASARLDGRVEFIHARAAATILMLQLAVEHAPFTANLGLEFDQDHGWDAGEFRDAMLSLDEETFWGKIKPDKTGWNTQFVMGIAQYHNRLHVQLVGPQSLLPTGEASKVVYPAEWSCELTHSCLEWWEMGLFAVSAVSVSVCSWQYVKDYTGRAIIFAVVYAAISCCAVWMSVMVLHQNLLWVTAPGWDDVCVAWASFSWFAIVPIMLYTQSQFKALQHENDGSASGRIESPRPSDTFERSLHHITAHGTTAQQAHAARITVSDLRLAEIQELAQEVRVTRSYSGFLGLCGFV